MHLNVQSSTIYNGQVLEAQTDSNQGGGGRGIIGEWPRRNMYEGHMGKAKGDRIKGGRRGWVGSREWKGENGDNYLKNNKK